VQALVGGHLEVVPGFFSIEHDGAVRRCVAFCDRASSRLAIRTHRPRDSVRVRSIPGYSVTELMRDRVFPVCSPRLIAERGAVRTIDELLNLPLVHDSATEGDGSASDWRSWLDHLGRPDAACRSGERFSEATLLIEAAVLGLGVALARASLVSDHMASGVLICPLALATPTAFAYYLVALPEAAGLPKIVLFRHWLQAEASGMPA
jgi:LysR family transcriptional regulator, glycine cleavage system transcriptional activator